MSSSRFEVDIEVLYFPCADQSNEFQMSSIVDTEGRTLESDALREGSGGHGTG